MKCFPKVAPKVIHRLFKNCKSWFKIYAKALKNYCKGFYTLLSWHNNTVYMEYLFVFKEIVSVSLNTASLKAGDKN